MKTKGHCSCKDRLKARRACSESRRRARSHEHQSRHFTGPLHSLRQCLSLTPELANLASLPGSPINLASLPVRRPSISALGLWVGLSIHVFPKLWFACLCGTQFIHRAFWPTCFMFLSFLDGVPLCSMGWAHTRSSERNTDTHIIDLSRTQSRSLLGSGPSLTEVPLGLEFWVIFNCNQSITNEFSNYPLG